MRTGGWYNEKRCRGTSSALKSELRRLRGSGRGLCGASGRLRRGSRRGRGRRRRGRRGRGRGAPAAVPAGAAASNRLMTSAVRSSAGSPQTMPGVAPAEEHLEPSLGHDLLDDREQLALEGVLEVLLQLLDFFLRVLLKRWSSFCCRSMSRSSWPRAASFSTAVCGCSFCWSACSFLFRSFSSATFFWLSACTLPVEALPSVDSAATRWMSMNANLVPSGNGRGGCGRGRRRGGGGWAPAPGLGAGCVPWANVRSGPEHQGQRSNHYKRSHL